VRFRTLEQAGKEFGVTRERIRQLQNVAISKMRQSLARMEDPSVQAIEGVMEKFRDSSPELAHAS
jgi:RNA polymerase primary sigma factor